MIIFVGNRLKGGFVLEVAKSANVKQEVVFIDEKPHIAEQKAEILLAAAKGCKNIIYDIDQYYDSPDILISEIISIRQTNMAEPIILAPTINSKNLIVSEGINQGIKRFINAGATFSEQKEQLVKCITGYYDANIRSDVISVKEKNEKKQLLNKKFKTIGLAGSMHRIGTSTQALQFIKYIKMQGFKACYVEMNNIKYPNLKLSRRTKPEISYVEKNRLFYELDRDDEELGLITYEGIDMFYKQERLSEILDRDYDYIVYDYGAYMDRDFNKQAFLKDDLKFFVAGSDAASLDYTLDIIDNLSYAKANLIFSFTAEGDRADLLDFMAGFGAHDRCYFADYTPNPFVLSNPELYDNLLNIKAQDETEEKAVKKKFSLFKRGE